MNKSNPKVSIIIPVYNGADYLKGAINSALAQTYKNFEIIIVNDGSTDDTERIAKTYGNKIRYFKKENGGVASALNLALKEMKGDYFSWLSHDDAYYPQKLEVLVDRLNSLKDKNVILYSNYAVMNSASRVVRKFIFDHQMLREKSEYALLRGMINGNTLLIPGKAFKDYGDFDEKLTCTQDYAKWYEMSQTYKFVHVPEVLIKYRVHPGQDTKKNPKFITEGDYLWIKMMKGQAVETMQRLEGSVANFYDRMVTFLEKTPYKEAIKFAEEKLVAAVAEKKGKRFFVTFVAHSSGISGAERAMITAIDSLLLEDVFVYVVLPKAGSLEELLRERGVDYSFRDIRSCLWARWTIADDIKRQIVENSVKLADFLRKLKPDVVVSVTSVIFEGAFAAKMAGIPHIWSISEYGRREHGIRFLVPDANRLEIVRQYSDKVVFVSEALRNHYTEKVDLKNSFVIPPILASEITNKKVSQKVEKRYFGNQSSLKLILAGNIDKGKGQMDAVLAIGELNRLGLNTELVLVGPGGNRKYHRELLAIIKRKKLGNIKILSEVKDVLPLFRQADIVLMCSVYESFGRVTAEALLCGKPVIGANSGATPELVKDGVNGFLYEPGNYKELASNIEYFVKHKGDLNEFGQNGYQIITEKLDDEENKKKFVAEIKAVGEDKPKKPGTGEARAEIEQILGLDNISLPQKVRDAILGKIFAQIPRLRRVRDKIRGTTR